MSDSMFLRAATARRRMSVLRCALDFARSSVPACRPSPVYAAERGRLRGKPLGAIVLAVLAAHFLLALELWDALAPGMPTVKPRPVDVEVDLHDGVQPSAPVVPQRSAPKLKDIQPAPLTPRPHKAADPRGARESVPSRRTVSTAQAPTPEVARADTPGPGTPSATGQPPVDRAPDNPIAVPNTAATQERDAQPAPQPATEPDFSAAYLHNPAPSYPATAQRRSWQGTVLLKVHVLANGLPDQVLIASTSGQPSLDDAAVEAVTGWRFVPAKRGTQAVDGWVKVPIDFKLGT